MLNCIVVFKVGFEPGDFGCVLMFDTAGPFGGIKLLILKFMNAFFTGRIPGDWRFLKPRMSILTSISAKSTLSCKLTS